MRPGTTSRTRQNWTLPLAATIWLVTWVSSAQAGSPLVETWARLSPTETHLPGPSSQHIHTLNLAMPALPASARSLPSVRLNEPRANAATVTASGAMPEGQTNLVDPSAEHFVIRWQSHPDGVDPEVVRLAHNFRRNGLPVVHLWQSGRNLLAVGLNPHGVPGIYFTQKLPE